MMNFVLRNVHMCSVKSLNYFQHSSAVVSSLSNRTSFVHSRYLSQNEAATALRPFYFAVHPDLFNQYPEKQTVNQESLKNLNAHIESLLNGNKVTAISLKFFKRDTQGKGASKLITISLQSTDVRSAVKNVLSACDIPLDYVNSIKSKTIKRKEVHQGIPDFEEPPLRPTITLSSWLNKNIHPARQFHESSKALLVQKEKLKVRLKEEYGLADIQWVSNWGVVQFNNCMRNMLRLCEEYKNEDFVKNLKGQVLVFSCESGVNLHGHIHLSFEDVRHAWMKLLTRISGFQEVLKQVPDMEKRLSVLLNNIQIVRADETSIVMADRYLRQVQGLCHILECETRARLKEDLSNLQLIVGSKTGSLKLTRDGQFVVPNSCPGYMLIEFLQQKKTEALILKYEYVFKKAEQEAMIDMCVSDLGLESLTSEDELLSTQVIESCKRLVNNPRDIGVSLVGQKLRLSTFYSVMQDGEIVIPWNWKGAG